MASALQNVSALGNPNDRRRINLVTRYAVKKGIDPTSAVKLWLSEKDKAASDRTINKAVGRQRFGESFERGKSFKDKYKSTADFAAAQQSKILGREVAPGEKLSDADRKKINEAKKAHLARYKATKAAVAVAFQEQGGYGEHYADRALGSHASRYRLTDKRKVLAKTSKNELPFMLWGKPAKGRTVVNTDSDTRGTQFWSKSRKDRRAAGQWGHKLPSQQMLDWLIRERRFARGQKVSFAERYGEGEMVPVLDGRGQQALDQNGQPLMVRKFATKPLKGQSYADMTKNERRKTKKGKTRYTGVPKYSGRTKSGKKFSRSMSGSMMHEMALARKAKAGAQTYEEARENSSALMNPAIGNFDGIGSFLTGYVVPVGIAGAVGGSVHVAAEKIGVTDFLAKYVAMVPVAGPWVADNAIHTVQGAAVCSLLAAIASRLDEESAARKYLGLIAGTTLVFGIGRDTAAYVGSLIGASEDTGDLAFGDLAFTNTSALGDLAFTNESSLGDLAFTNGGAATPSFSAASLSVEDYAQSSLGDALYSGADFSGVEGQALVNGKGIYVRRFGNVPVRAAARTANVQSHLAGREGHRWGWLIKMIGWERAQKLAALPPRQRVALIAKLRKAAIAAFQQSVALDLAAQAAASQQLSSGATAADVAKAHELAQAADAGFPGGASDLVLPAAGQVLSGAAGASGASSANGSEFAGMDYMGDPTLFMGA